MTEEGRLKFVALTADSDRQRRVRLVGPARAQRMKDVLYDIADSDSQPAMVRVQAADKALDREEGKAITRGLNLDLSEMGHLTDEQLSSLLRSPSDHGGIAAPEGAD